ncbi:MAG: hypothetical protein GKR91_12505 [Pseudomonadales bacterium]|nr:hypothetical protein [Pseudomonadales bacterium]
MNKIVAALFTISCFGTAAASNSLLGAGMWFFIIVAAGIFVTASQFHPWFRELGGIAASILGMISVLAVLLTLLAATIGGSFELGGSEALLVFGFTMIAIFGFLLARINKKFKTYSSNQ